MCVCARVRRSCPADVCVLDDLLCQLCVRVMQCVCVSAAAAVCVNEKHPCVPCAQPLCERVCERGVRVCVCVRASVCVCE